VLTPKACLALLHGLEHGERSRAALVESSRNGSVPVDQVPCSASTTIRRQASTGSNAIRASPSPDHGLPLIRRDRGTPRLGREAGDVDGPLSPSASSLSGPTRSSLPARLSAFFARSSA
jgi:hypothetical protein